VIAHRQRRHRSLDSLQITYTMWSTVKETAAFHKC
jgi:hypothetical protein